jgi:hypothetical protein
VNIKTVEIIPKGIFSPKSCPTNTDRRGVEN